MGSGERSALVSPPCPLLALPSSPPAWVGSPSTETHPALLPMKEGKINDSSGEDCACLTLQSFREINLDIKQEVILCVAERDLREVIAPRYFKAKVWGSISQTSAWTRVTWRAY